ncbi:hypothetical protein ACOBQX_08580 [Actinokineospora sp. G85]|uniref:hypothetical protein n=1 Tax=Actinokineospora sp. G85 TaxID=3406626 RepID=UPI003C76D82E
MPTLLSEHHAQLVPAYRTITLRDADSDSGHDPHDALGRAHQTIAACTGHELYIVCAHDLLPVTVKARHWDTDPAITPPDNAAGLVGPFGIDFPTGVAVLSSPTAEATDFTLATGPGTYTATLECQGRTHAEELHRGHASITHASDSSPCSPDLRSIEAYTIHLWRTGELDDD